MALDLLARLDPLRRVSCPFCLDQFAAFQTHMRCDSKACRSNFTHQIDDPILTRALNGQSASAGRDATLKSPWWTRPFLADERRLRSVLDLLILPATVRCPICEERTSLRLCPRCHRELPDRIWSLERSGSITIFGPQAVGKTTYLTVLLEEIRKSDHDDRRLGLKPLNDEIRARYRTEYHEITYGSRDGGVGGARTLERARHTPTLSLEIDRRVLQPLVYELKPMGRDKPSLLSLVDLAGEDWEMKIDLLRKEGRDLLRRSGGLLFLIDPMRLPDVAGQMVLTEEEAMVAAADYVEDADKLADFFERTPVKMPLAVCLNKLDRWGTILNSQSALHQAARSIPTAQPDRHLDAVIHDEVQAALRNWGQEEFLDRLKTDFTNHRFFACSALGDAASSRSDLPPPAPTPLLVERAVLWLLSQQGLITRT